MFIDLIHFNVIYTIILPINKNDKMTISVRSAKRDLSYTVKPAVRDHFNRNVALPF